MSVWYAKSLGDGMVAIQPLSDVQQQFQAAYARAGSPADMALFVRHESAGDLHCELRIYLSPAAAPLAKALDATPCARPSPHGLGLLVGSEDAWSALFPTP